jgi:hypothetical protein
MSASSRIRATIHSAPELCPDPKARSAFPAEGIEDSCFELAWGSCVLGRDSPSGNGQPDIVIRDPGASKAHVRIEVGTDGCFATDLGSSNGTTLDGKGIEPKKPFRLGPGSVLRIGMWTMVAIEACPQ